MAKKHSSYPIPNLDSDWASNPTDNLPQSGQQVQQFIRSKLRDAVGSAWFNQANSTIYFFHNSVDRDAYVLDQTRTDLIVSSTPLNFSSQMYRVYVTNNLPSYNIQAATNEREIILSLDFDVQTKTVSDSS